MPSAKSLCGLIHAILFSVGEHFLISALNASKVQQPAMRAKVTIQWYQDATRNGQPRGATLQFEKMGEDVRLEVLRSVVLFVWQCLFCCFQEVCVTKLYSAFSTALFPV